MCVSLQLTSWTWELCSPGYREAFFRLSFNAKHNNTRMRTTYYLHKCVWWCILEAGQMFQMIFPSFLACCSSSSSSSSTTLDWMERPTSKCVADYFLCVPIEFTHFFLYEPSQFFRVSGDVVLIGLGVSHKLVFESYHFNFYGNSHLGRVLFALRAALRNLLEISQSHFDAVSVWKQNTKLLQWN